MRTYSQNNRAKFHPDQISNEGALGFYEECLYKKNKMSRAIWDQFLINNSRLLEMGEALPMEVLKICCKIF